jgi:hypothetical protein
MSTFSLAVELVVLGLLAGGFALKRLKKFRQHAITMLTAVVLHLITILTVMVWSFLSFFGAPGSIDFANTLVLVTLIHTALGIIAASLGVWLVASWHLQTNIQMCFARKKVMLATLTSWLTAISLGIIMYVSIVFS